MFKKLLPFILVIILTSIIWLLFYSTKPKNVLSEDIPKSEFSTLRAFSHVVHLSKAPHYVGSAAHSEVRSTIIDELQEMGLEVQTQEGYVLNQWGELTFAKNILAKIPGTRAGKSLVLMSHFDSAGHSSFGASDAASGVATILEGLRAFLYNGKSNANDIIVLFTDAEELGLLGAKLFVDRHSWAKDVGLALNFESRGSGGNSFMLLEINKGNARLIKEFKNADLKFPVANSLAYSVYKLLPNDTDLTVMRENGGVNGFNFAFVDDHLDYHTANDIAANMDKETLAHQGSYLMPLLYHFSKVDLSKMESTEDLIYFTIPTGEIITYPFTWIFPMWIIAFVFFAVVLFFGVFKKNIDLIIFLKGAVPYLFSLVGAAITVFLLWQFCLILYPEYGEMEHGFTYNGYYYISATIFLSLSINFMAYHIFDTPNNQAEYFVFPLFFWLVLCLGIAFFLPGAAYFIIAAFFGILQLWFMLKQKRPNLFFMLLLSLPALIILYLFIITFTVVLGLKILFVTSIFTSLLFMLFLPVFSYFKVKKMYSQLCFFIFSILFVTAHFHSSFSEKRQKPNSLVYLQDIDNQRAVWRSYDGISDSWTQSIFGESPEAPKDKGDFSSNYRSNFTFRASAPLISIEETTIVFERIKDVDKISKTGRYSLKIVPKRKINRMELFTDRRVNFLEFRVNGQEADSLKIGTKFFHIFSKRWNKRLLTYHAINRDTLRIEFTVEDENLPEFNLFETSFNLLENEQLNVLPREKTMIPRPFVLNDAIIIKKTIKLE